MGSVREEINGVPNVPDPDDCGGRALTVTVALVDSLFETQYCLHASDDAEGRFPLHVLWNRYMAPSFRARLRWFTDSSVKNVQFYEADRKVAWLVEPRELHPENYAFVLNNADQFHDVVTHDPEYFVDIPYVTVAPSGGTRLHPSDWRIPSVVEKRFLVTAVATHKNSLPGHALRNEVYERISGKSAKDASLTNHVRKRELVVPAAFHVAVENVKRPYWFTECLIDPLLAGSVPIYWGSDASTLESFGFDTQGIIMCETADEIVEAASRASMDHWWQLRDAGVLRHNLVTAMEYQMTEDYLYRAYPYLFGG